MSWLGWMLPACTERTTPPWSPHGGVLLLTLARGSIAKASHREPRPGRRAGSEIPRGTFDRYRIIIFRRDGGGLAYPASVSWFRLTRIQPGDRAFGYTVLVSFSSGDCCTK